MTIANTTIAISVDESKLYLFRILLGYKKENFTLCDSTDGPGEHYDKGNKPVRERQIPYDFTHVESNEHNELTSKVETDP